MIYKQHKSNIKPNTNKLTKKKLNKCWFKAEEIRIPFRLSVRKYASALSSYVIISVALYQNCRDLCSYFLLLPNCKSEVKLWGQLKVMEGQ